MLGLELLPAGAVNEEPRTEKRGLRYPTALLISATPDFGSTIPAHAPAGVPAMARSTENAPAPRTMSARVTARASR